MSEVESLFSELHELVNKHDYLQALQVIELLEYEKLSAEQTEHVNSVFDQIHKQ